MSVKKSRETRCPPEVDSAFQGVTKLKDIPRITASPRRPQGGGAMP